MKFLLTLVVVLLSLSSYSVAGDLTPLQKSPAQKTATQKAEPTQKGDAEAEHLGFWARRRVRISSRQSVRAVLLVGRACSNCR